MSSLCTITSPSQVWFGPGGCFTEFCTDSKLASVSAGVVPRCAATTRDPGNGARDLPTVRMIKSYRGVQVTESGRGVHFGVYAEVVREGVLRVGDPLTPTAARQALEDCFGLS